MIIAIIRVASGPVCRSRMIARGMTITVAAPRPWTKRAAVKVATSGANAQPSVPARKMPSPISNGGRRPIWSDSGP